MPKAISYMRFSASHQEKGSTIERQQERIDRWLADHPEVERSHLSQIDKGASGYKGEHLDLGFGAILKSIENGEIQSGDYLLVEAIDRLGRLKPLEMISLLTPIVGKGVIIVTLEDNQHYSENTLNDNGAALFILAGKVQQAYEYSNRLSGRLLAAHKSKRKNAKDGLSIKKINPIWLNNMGKLIPENAKMVKACIDLYLKGKGARGIILSLYKTYKHLESVHPTTLNRWFSNPAIIGEWHTKDQIIDNVFEPLIERDLYHRLQREIQSRSLKPSPPKSYDLSGILVCGKCGHRFHYRRKKHNDYTIVYANCSNYLKRGKIYCDNNKTWPYEVLSYIYRQTFPDYLFLAASSSPSKSNVEVILNRKNELQEISLKINRLIEMGMVTENELDEIKSKLKELQRRRQEIEKEVVMLEREDNSQDYDYIEYGRSIEQSYWDTLIDDYKRRETLIKFNFRLTVLGDEVSVKMIEKPDFKYKLIKRSTANNCYFVEAQTDFNYKTKAPIDRKTKLAINREGLCAMNNSADISWEEFANNLDKYSSFEPEEGIKIPLNITPYNPY